MEKITNFNNAVAIRVTLIMSTMWCVYAFTLWSLLPSFFHATEQVVFYVSGGIIQLVALPLIMVGQDLLSRGSEQRAAQDHKALMESLAAIHSVLKAEQTEDATLIDIKNRLDRLEQILVSKNTKST